MLQQAVGHIALTAQHHQADALDVDLYFPDQATLAAGLLDGEHQHLLGLGGFTAAHGQARKDERADERHVSFIVTQVIECRLAVLGGQRAVALQAVDDAPQGLPACQ
ncbi:hypothetical protein D3C76_685260 [compost metagenome]